MQALTNRLRKIKWCLVIATAIVSVGSLVYSHRLTNQLLEE